MESCEPTISSSCDYLCPCDYEPEQKSKHKELKLKSKHKELKLNYFKRRSNKKKKHEGSCRDNNGKTRRVSRSIKNI